MKKYFGGRKYYDFKKVVLSLILPNWSIYKDNCYIMFPTLIRFLNDEKEGIMFGLTLLGFGLAIRIKPRFEIDENLK